LLTWKFDTKGNSVAETKQEQADNENGIVLQHEHQNQVEIKQKDISESHKTLGTHKSILGVEDDHIRFLKLKSNEYAHKAIHSQLTREQARLGYTYHYIPSMSYSLTAMCLNEQKLYCIQQKALREFIRIQGYEANFPRAVVFGPKKYGGVQLEQLYSYCYCMKIECLITNINLESLLGGLLHKDLQWVQIHRGKSTPILCDERPIKYVEDNWFLGIKQFLNEVNGKIAIEKIWTPKKL
jgi:hypothetical protein